MRSTTFSLGGKPIKLYYSTKAMLDIEKRCEDTSKLGEWLQQEGTTGETITKIAGILTDLANGAVYKHNAEVALGLSNEEKKDFYDVETFSMLLTPADFLEAKEAIFSAINKGMKYEIPEGAPEPDPDLAEVESEKNV